LDSEAEIDTAGIETRWQVEDADWRDYEPLDDDAIFERFRDERNGL
jgi:hypothetical protein